MKNSRLSLLKDKIIALFKFILRFRLELLLSILLVNYFPDYDVHRVSPQVTSFKNAISGVVRTDVVGAYGNAWSAFDNSFTGEVFHSALGAKTGELIITLDKKEVVNSLKIAMQTNMVGRLPKSFILQGLSDKSEWITLLEVVDEKYVGMLPATFKQFSVANVKAFKVYKIIFNETNGDDYLTFSELVLETVKDNRLLKILSFTLCCLIILGFSYWMKPKQDIQENTDFKFSNKSIVYVVLSVVTTLFLFIPFNLYLENINEFFYDAFVIGGSLLVFCVLASTIIYASLLLLKAKYKVYAVRILFFIGLFAWISAVFFPWGYGELDGLAYPMPINIDGYLHLLILSALLVWCCAIGFKHIDRLLLSIALVVFLCQSTSFVINLFTIDNKLSATSTKNLTEFSQNNKNVIIILLDMYQSNVFQEILDKNYFDNAVDFDGFKYFRNAVSAFPVTVASVPQILTGVSFDNSMTHSEYIEKTFKESSLFKHAYESGFSIAAKPLLYNELLIDGSFNKESGSRDVLFKPLLLDLSKLFDASFFVDLPFLLKNIVYRDGEWFIQNIAASYLSSKNNSNQDGNRSSKVVDIKFVDDFIIDSNAVNEKSTFKFYHLFGNHPPLDLNESIMYEPMDFNLQNSIRQGVGSMKLAVKLLARLKTLGVYDNSMIFIIADHGSGVETKSISGVSGWLARGVPLILAKNYNDHGRIQTSDAPVELSDIGSTISVRNHWVNDFHGLDIFTIKEDITRTRRFINTSIGSLVHGKFEMYEKYDVIGHSWDASSWVYVN